MCGDLGTWGLGDLGNNNLPISLFLTTVNFAHPFSILDLKACYRAFKYVDEVIKLLPQKPEPILISPILNQVTNLGAIHSVSVTSISPKITSKTGKNYSPLLKTS